MFNLKKLLLFLFLVVGCCSLYAQNRVLKGKVTSLKDGLPLPGVIVSVKGTNKATASGPDGLFTINVPAGAIAIEVRSLGYITKEVSFNDGQNNVVIGLDEDNKQLNEVVVTGYSNMKKSEISSAITVVSAEKLKDVTSDDVGAMLQGKVAGLQVVNSSGAPGSSSEIRIRGVSSVNASQNPLYVVDGIIGGNFDPNDVESITVLKDAGATAIYGSQANAGVIIVTTKKAKDNKTHYEFKATTGFRDPDYGSMQMMSSSQLYEYQKGLFRDYVPGATNNTYVVDLVQFQAARPLSLLNTNTNWLSTMFKAAPMENYYFSASGKTAKNDYYFGVTYYNETGTFIKTGYQRVNLRANSTYHFTDKISLTNNINVSGTTAQGYDQNDIYYAYLNMPWDNPYDANHNPIYVDGNSTFKWWSRDNVNPLNTVDNSDFPSKNFDVNYDIALNLPITPWLTFNSSNRLNAGYYDYSSFYSPEVSGQYHGTGYLYESNSFSYGGISNDLLKFNFQFGDHAISGLAGMAFEGSNYQYLTASGQGLPFGLQAMNVVSAHQAVGGAPSANYLISYLSQVTYSYKDRYFFTGSYRTDGSSNFPPANRYASFPSVSGAWLASNEDFLKDNKVIDNLKLRVSYGITGTQDIGSGTYLGLYSLSSQYNSSPAAEPSQLQNLKLTWESKDQLDAGIDISLFKRVVLTVDAYHNVTKNLLLQVSQPLSIGFATRWENAGSVLNNGLELGLNTTNIHSANFKWTTDFNINFNNNVLSDFPAPVINTVQPGISQIYQTGGSLYDFYMPKWLGVNSQTGQPLWEVETFGANGKVTGRSSTSDYAQATPESLGSALPKLQGGFNNEFVYKNFNLRINFYYVYGNKIYDQNLMSVMNDGSEPMMNQMVAPKGTVYWTQPGDIATEPSPQNAANSTDASSRYIKDGSYINLRNITFGYSLPKNWVKSLKMDDINVSLSADNVYTFTKFVGQDPQTSIDPNGYMPGVSYFKYPNNHQYLLNINVKF